MIKCSLCNKEFTTKRSFSIHLTTIENSKFENETEKERFLIDTLYGKDKVNSLIEDYKNEKISCYCLSKDNFGIVKYLSLIGVKRTSKEERKTKRYKETYLKGIQDVYGIEITNISQSSIVKKKKEETVIKNFGSLANYYEINLQNMLSGYEKYVGSEKQKDTIEKIKQTMLETYGVDNISKHHEVRKINSQKAKERLSLLSEEERFELTRKGREARISRGGTESSIERIVQHSLVDLGIEFKKHVTINKKNYDIVIDNYFFIEIQGDFWHANPKKYKETDLLLHGLVKDIWNKDKKKKELCLKDGNCFIEIWESDIRQKNKDELDLFILEKLLENGYVFN